MDRAERLRRCQWQQGAMGYSLLEVLLVMGVILTIGMISVPQYIDAVIQARVAKAIGDIAVIGREVQLYWVEEARYPASLAEVGFADYPDPYGNEYVYLNIADQALGDLGIFVGRMRVDRFQVPINTDFDLYSLGADEMTLPLLIAPVSLDDIIRAADGGFIGLAEDY